MDVSDETVDAGIDAGRLRLVQAIDPVFGAPYLLCHPLLGIGAGALS